MSDIKLCIACHKPCDVPKSDIYLPVQAGSALHDPIPGFTPDNSGDNISDQNPMFSELTVVYWAWKNLPCDYFGLVHYRRYFTMKSKSYQKNHEEMESVLTKEELEPMLKQYQVLVPKKRHYYIETIYSHYAHTFDGKQLNLTKEILQKKYPEYVESFDRVMNQRSGYMFNMFIMNKKLADQYCEWLFDILFTLVKEYSADGLSGFEMRYPGRISERLFNVWLDYQVRSDVLDPNEIHEVPYMYFGQIDWKRKITSFLAAKLFHKKYTKSF